MRFLVVSAPRSGTKYAAEVFSALGLPCGHEHVYNLVGLADWETPGESSWLAAPYLSELPEDVIVLHQRRERLHAALSMVRHGFFSEGDRFREWAEQWVPTGSGGDVDRALLFLDGWHALISSHLRGRTHVSYRLEALDGQLLRRICYFLGIVPAEHLFEQALALPHTIHSNIHDRNPILA